MDEDECRAYEIELVPKLASDEDKTAITFKGNDSEYVAAQKLLKGILNKKGERFLINEIEISITDTPKNRPMIIGVKPKDGITGKANLKLFQINNRGGATIMTQRAKGGDNITVRALGIKVIKYLVNGLKAGSIKEKDFQKFKIKNQIVADNRSKSEFENMCQICEKGFRTEQGVKLHMNRIHEGVIRCNACIKTFQNESEMKIHMNRVHEHERETKCESCEKRF